VKKIALAALLLAGLLFALPANDTACENCTCDCGCECGEDCACVDACACECNCAEGCADGCECACKDVAAEASRCVGMSMGSCGGCGR
jgi:hypothetical protein